MVENLTWTSGVVFCVCKWEVARDSLPFECSGRREKKTYLHTPEQTVLLTKCEQAKDEGLGFGSHNPSELGWKCPSVV